MPPPVNLPSIPSAPDLLRRAAASFNKRVEPTADQPRVRGLAVGPAVAHPMRSHVL